MGSSPATQHLTLQWRLEAADALYSIAIIVVCLASFRALFTRESRRSRIPYAGDTLRNLFLPAAIRHNGQITTSISASGDTEAKFLTTSSDESNVSVMPPDKVHVRHEIKQSISPRDMEHGNIEAVEDHPRNHFS